MLESILHMDHYKDGIDKLRTRMKQHTPRQVIGIDCIKNGTNIKLIDSKGLLFYVSILSHTQSQSVM